MKTFKRKIFRLFFACEVILFVMVYIFGMHGIQSLLRLQKENELLEAYLRDLQYEVQVLEQDICSWHMHTFYKEKIAREQLQMAHADDKIYYSTS